MKPDIISTVEKRFLRKVSGRVVARDFEVGGSNRGWRKATVGEGEFFSKKCHLAK